jgi:hypothetical protein
MVTIGMVRATKRTRRLLAATLAVALVVVSSATCVLGANVTPAQKACCTAMNHDCGAMAMEQGCCAPEAPNLTSLVSSMSTSLLAAPVLVVLGLTAAEFAPSTILSTSGIFDLASPTSQRKPTYLFFSVFRI